MNHGIVNIPCIPLRREPSESSEMVSQLLFGEMYTILGTENGWVQVRNDFDSYEGWIPKNVSVLLDEEEFNRYRNFSSCYQSATFLKLQKKSGEEPMMVPAGSILYFKDDQPLRVFCVDAYRMEKPCKPSNEELPGSLIDTGRQFLHIPYLWGGKSSFGTDCSGLVQTIFRIHGIKLSRDTSQQVHEGEALNMLPEARTGDLVFFDNEEGEIIHVGMLMEEGFVLHASGMVRIDPIDHQGIYNREQKRYTHKLRVIKRVIK